MPAAQHQENDRHCRTPFHRLFFFRHRRLQSRRVSFRNARAAVARCRMTAATATAPATTTAAAAPPPRTRTRGTADNNVTTPWSTGGQRRAPETAPVLARSPASSSNGTSPRPNVCFPASRHAAAVAVRPPRPRR